jgi:hypothetical protein
VAKLPELLDTRCKRTHANTARHHGVLTETAVDNQAYP